MLTLLRHGCFRLAGAALDGCYALLLVAIAPWLVWRLWVQRKPIAGATDKLFGTIRRQSPEADCVWMHAVSVGEVLLLPALVQLLRTEHPGVEILVTTTTSTGREVALKTLPGCTIAWFPFDFSFAVRRALRTVRPRLMVLVELELWPNFLLVAAQQGVPVAMVNARLGERSASRYRLIAPLMRGLLRSLAVVVAQSPEVAARFRALGMSPERLHVAGNLKFDRVQTDRLQPATLALSRALQIEPQAPVWVVGSTQDPEELLAIQVWERVREDYPALQLLLVPRHRERFEAVAGLVTQRGHRLLRRSDTTGPDRSIDLREQTENAFDPVAEPVAIKPQATLGTVRLLDTLGELSAAWGLAQVAFVGGSLTQRGGQNMLEPAAYGAAVCFGPNTWNFREIVRELLQREAAVVVRDAAALERLLRNWLAAPQTAQELGLRARQFVLQQQGATDQTWACLRPYLHSDRLAEPAAAHGAVETRPFEPAAQRAA